MDLKDAYKQAMQEELQPLLDAGKITVMGTLESVVEDLAESFFKALRKGAILSTDKWDDILVIPATDFLESRLQPYVDKIDGKEGQ